MKIRKAPQPTTSERFARLETTVKLLQAQIRLLISRLNKKDTGDSPWRD